MTTPGVILGHGHRETPQVSSDGTSRLYNLHSYGTHFFTVRWKAP
jgi:hypothetical protein